MVRLYIAAVLLSGCAEIGRSCTDAGCGGQLTILLDRPLADGAVVTLDDGETVHACAGGADTGDQTCQLTELDGQSAVVLSTGMDADVAPVLTLVVVEGDATVTHTVEPAWNEVYPNGERCGPVCSSAEVAVTL